MKIGVLGVFELGLGRQLFMDEQLLTLVFNSGYLEPEDCDKALFVNKLLSRLARKLTSLWKRFSISEFLAHV